MEKTSREYAEKLAGEFWQDDRLTKLNIMPNTFEKAMFIEGYMKAVEETNVKGLLESLIIAKNLLIDINPLGLTESQIVDGANPDGTFMKIINTIKKAIK